MDPLSVSLIGFAAILILAFLRFPLALAMGLVGVIGFGEISGYRAAISNLGRLVMDLGQSYSLSVLPLFILMGLLVEKGGMAKQLYRAAYAFLGNKIVNQSIDRKAKCTNIGFHSSPKLFS